MQKWSKAESPWFEPVFIRNKAYHYAFLAILGSQLKYYPITSFSSEKCPSSDKCKNTVTYRGVCIHTSEVGNIIYGAAARFFRLTWLQTWGGGIAGNRGKRTDADAAAVEFGWKYIDNGWTADLSFLSTIKTDAPQECLPCYEVPKNKHIILPSVTPTLNEKTGVINEIIIPK